jgi:alcohol dehydrogenase
VETEAPFWNHLPIRIRFGDGVVGELDAILDGAGLSRPFVVLDPAVASIPTLAAALAAIRPAETYAIPAHEPTTASVEAAGAALAAAEADAVIAVGGGSALDTAKGARIVATHGAPVRRFAWPGSPAPIAASNVRLVTIPTTAGTGSEVTGGCVMYHEGHKVSGANPVNRADWALVDPVLTHGLPQAPTRYTGADALAQALAAVVVRVRTPIGDAVGLEGTRLCAQAYPAVVRDGSDAAARNRMMLGSMMAGLAMNIAEAGTEHALGEPLGHAYGLPHGLTIGLMLAESMDVDRRHVPERFERIADALGEPEDGTGDGSRAVRGVRRLLAEVGFPTLREVGASEADVERLTGACHEAWIPVEPGPWTRDDIAGAYRAALAIERREA